MKRNSLGIAIGIIASLIIGFGVLAGVWLGLHSIDGLGHQSDVVQATKTGPGSATLNLSAFPDSNACHTNVPDLEASWVSYCAGADSTQNADNLEIPANSLITVVIKQYDSATELHNDYFQTVRGTLDGTMMVNGKSMSSIDATNVAHTFTLQSTPNSSFPIFVSVPLMGTASDAPSNTTVAGNQYPAPNTITFQFRTGPPETYIWHCYDPCGSGLQGSNEGFGGPMSTLGYMAGKVTVANY